MKNLKLFVTILLLICFLSGLNAQITKGRMIIGLSTSIGVNSSTDLLSLGFSTQKYKSNSPAYQPQPAAKVTSLNFQPKLGFFIFSNFALGADLLVGTSKLKEGAYSSSQTSLGIGPFARYYINGKVMPFFEVNSLFGNINYKSTYSTTTNTDKSSVTSIGFGAGLAVPIGDKVKFDMMAGYNSTTQKYKTDNTTNARVVEGTISFRFGFFVLLGSKP
jgi:hypothetical protein